MSAKLGFILGGLLAPAVAETIHGAAVFSRHGDSKWNEGSSPMPCIPLC